ncbi:MAG: LLM class flavin-dependent oxidoreductase [Dehalococcoidia bacterium]|nr:LLM class flavin-dependent oxidoreductase [Dehalococcoidia bacterium]
MSVKVIIQMYPVMPARDEHERETRRPLGRDRDLYYDVIHGMTDVVKAADELGYWGFTTVEHHFHSEGYELGPSPGILNAHWASQVKQLRVGQLGYVMGAQHPLRVAEETAILDHLTHGKFFVGFARGYQSRWTNVIGQHLNSRAALPPGVDGTSSAEAEAQRQSDDELNRRIFEDQVDLVLKSWTQESIEHKSDYFQVPYPHDTGVVGYPAAQTARRMGGPGEIGDDGEVRRLSVVPAPFQRPHPPVFISSAASMEAVEYAAKKDFNIGYFLDIDKLEERAIYYREVAKNLGRDVPLGYHQGNIRWIHFSEDQAGFDDALKAFDLDIYKNFYAAFFPNSHFTPGTTDKEWVQSIKDSGLFIGGTVDDVKRRLVSEWERVPAEYLIFIWHYAQQPKEDVIREMEVFMKEVYPEIRDAFPEPAVARA